MNIPYNNTNEFAVLRKEDWIIALIIIVSIAAIIFFHVRSSTIQRAYQMPPRPKVYSTPAPGPEVEIKVRDRESP
ncbi:MAG: hypothetical protein A2X86_10685 [Bdellovibrionales bacterium GWA2_49_15]|nr:MAG: hypothetical protein A2X86_10685 [Bdellovibrionales bacterium GWA2_49_15]HAZ11441.1 hypothetical protein [Bdellovibrionales bacterium]